MTDEEAVRIGRQANAELELTERAFADLREAFVNELIATSPDQSKKRENLYGALHAMTQVRLALLNAVEAGKTGTEMINYRQIMAERGFTSPY